MRGSVPKRSEERVRREQPEVEIIKIDVSKLQGTVEMPAPDPEWHPSAKRWYESFGQSAQCVFYEPSDWEMLWVHASDLSMKLKPRFVGMKQEILINEETGESRYVDVPHYAVKGLAAADLTALQKVATNALATEGDRRRMRIEIVREQQRAGVDTSKLEEEGDGIVGTHDELAQRRARAGNG